MDPLEPLELDKPVRWVDTWPLLPLVHSLSAKYLNFSYLQLYRPINDWRSKCILFFAVVLSVAAGAPLPIIGVIFSKIIDTFPPSEEAVKQRVVELIGVAIAYFGITWGWAVCWGLTGQRVSLGLRKQMIHRALGLDLTYYETECPDITSRLTSDAQTIQSGTSEKCGLFLQSVSYFFVAFAVGFSLNAKLTGILLVAVIPSMTFVIIAGTAVLNKYSKKAVEYGGLAGTVAEGAIKAVQVVQAFGAAEVLADDHRSYLHRSMRVGMRKAIAGASLLGGIYFVAFAANALAFWQGSKMVTSHGGAGTVYAIVFLILDASFVIGQAGPFIQSFALAASAGTRILSLIDYPTPKIDVYSTAGEHVTPETMKSNITFDKVTFAYPARPQETILRELSFTIKAGTTVGIVGSSGSGKSTIAALLLRLYDPHSGAVKVNDLPLPLYNLSSIRNKIALVDQDPAIFSGTIFTNIRQGIKQVGLTEEESRNQCIAAAKSAGAWTFIRLLPKGLDTPLGEPSGTKLSGGQKQRVCLARALVGDPDMLVLDEATSALDNITEAKVFNEMKRQRGGKTTVMIAHRLSTIRDADTILVMGGGKLLEMGSHNDLIASDGVYSKLVNAQKMESHTTPEAEAEVEVPEKKEEVIEKKEDKEHNEERQLHEEQAAETVEEDVSTIGTLSLLSRCLFLSKSKIPLLLIALLASTITGALVMGESIVFGNLVALLNHPPIPEAKTDFFCLMFFILSLIAFFAYTTSGALFGLLSENLIMTIRDMSLQTILRQDADWFLLPNHSVPSLTSVLTSDSGNLSGLSGVIIGTMFSALTSVIGGAILAHIVAWKIAIVLFATSPVVVLAGFFRIRTVAKLEEKSQGAYVSAATLASEACTAIRTVSVLSVENTVFSNFQEAVGAQKQVLLTGTIFGNLILAFALAITYFVYSLAYWWGARLVRSGEYSTLQFFIVLPAILFSAQASGQMFSLAPEVGRARGAAERVFKLLEQKSSIDDTEVTSGKSEISSSNVSVLDSNEKRGKIEFKDVCLTYKTRPNKPIFTNLNLTIQPGETVAFVGPSGAGKSSAISLIERFYDPTSGSVLIDGADIRTMPVRDHRARLALVSQEAELFTGSINFNIGMGARPGCKVTPEDIEKTCKECGVHEFVSGLGEGYETQCGNNGSQLSGGQKQRIAIARAMIRDPDVLLLDEATSALDSHSEVKVKEAVEKFNGTTIMVAHRLASVQRADRILVFEHGRVVEEGTHEVLRSAGGTYQQMLDANTMG